MALIKKTQKLVQNKQNRNIFYSALSLEVVEQGTIQEQQEPQTQVCWLGTPRQNLKNRNIAICFFLFQMLIFCNHHIMMCCKLMFMRSF